mmetsp:Transcript_10087/g.28512  ORF Transcript_10087/g.28512 Transcript_10087/m.28512 type:complete len:130 (-) Transcript_10087:252-641(-)
MPQGTAVVDAALGDGGVEVDNSHGKVVHIAVVDSEPVDSVGGEGGGGGGGVDIVVGGSAAAGVALIEVPVGTENNVGGVVAQSNVEDPAARAAARAVAPLAGRAPGHAAQAAGSHAARVADSQAVGSGE